jgi:hypothetical protein
MGRILAAERSMTADKSHVVSGLIAKRAELAGRIEHTQMELRRLVIDLDSLDATIRLFAPDIDLDEIRPKPLPARNQAFRGEMSRTVLNALRQARKPLPAYEIALLFMASRGLATADRPLLRVIHKRVGACLRNYRGKGLVHAIDGPGRTVVWEIMR